MSVRPLYDVTTAYGHWTNDFVLMGNVAQQKLFSCNGFISNNQIIIILTTKQWKHQLIRTKCISYGVICLFFEPKMNVMLKLRMEGVFQNQDYCGINFHVWRSLAYLVGIEIHDFAEKPRNHESFHQKKFVALKYITCLNAV